MATKANTTLPNFVGGELSPYMEGRVDLELFAKSLEWCQNFLIRQQGGAEFRPGSRLCGLTKNNAAAYMIPFQFSANDAYVIVHSDRKMRFYRNESVILNADKTITGITQANPAVVTSASHGFSNGDEVYISNVDGMNEVNGRFFIVANVAANTFELKDPFGTNVNSTAYGAYSAGGTAASIYELATPFDIAEIPDVRFAQTADLMYLVHKYYFPRKLTRSGHTSWTLAKFTRTSDPFNDTEYAISAMTIANPAVFTTSLAHGLAVGDRIYIEGTGTAQVQNKWLRIRTVPLTTTFTAYYDDGVTVVDSTGWTHSAGNSLVKPTKQPGCVAFSADGRACYAGSVNNPEGFWGSRAPTSGATRFDDFTVGSAATDAVIANLAPVEGVVDSIQEVKQYGKQFALLGSSSIRRMYGSAADQPPTPTAINTAPTIEGAAKVTPLIINNTMLFVDVSGKKLKGFQFNLGKDDYEAKNYNLVADHLGAVSFKKIVRTKGDPEIVWVLRTDGLLLAFAFNDGENIAGWARIVVGASGVVEDICSIRRDTGEDQLWLIVKRTMGGKTYRSVEVLSGRPNFPQRRSFYTGVEETDKANYENATWEQLKSPTYLDMTLTYDGTARGTAKNATLTPSAVSGSSITITSNNAVFLSSHVGRQIWKKYAADGSGGGQATITGYTSATQVTCQVDVNFDNTNAIAPGNWEFAVTEVTNLHLYEGLSVNLQTDGSGHPAVTVSAGKITLQHHAARVHAGFKYKGLLSSQNIDLGGRSGPANSKPRNIQRVKMRFKDSIGCKVGASEYRVQEIIFRKSEQIMGRVPPPYTGVKDLSQFGMWDQSSQKVVVLHEDPTPLTITAMDVEVLTVDQT